MSDVSSDDELFGIFEKPCSKSAETAATRSDDANGAAAEPNEEKDEIDRCVRFKRRVETFIESLMEEACGGKKAKTSDAAEPAESKEQMHYTRLFEFHRSKIITLESHETYSHLVAVPPGDAYDELAETSDPPPIKFEYKLDPFQAAAIRCVDNDQSVLVSAHTSAGKTAIAYYVIAHSLQQHQRVIYTSPIKALSNQKFREFCDRFPDVGLITGDVTINPTSTCLVMTTEILRSMLYHGSEVIKEVGWVIFDEIHYMRDRERGVVWEEAIILLPDTVRQVFLSATIPNGDQFAEWIAVVHSQKCHVISAVRRPVPLQHYIFPEGGDGIYQVYESSMEFNESRFNEAVEKMQNVCGMATMNRRGNKLTRNQSSVNSLYKVINLIVEAKLAPAIIFCFSRRECEAKAMDIGKKINFNSESEKELVDEVFQNAISLLSESDRKLPQINQILPMLRDGVGIHHSGLLPIMKELVEILFAEGLIKALFATETFSMGLNMPAKTVLFTTVRKFDGSVHRWITSGEYIQMSGRAGRRGIDSRGLVIMVVDSKITSDVAKSIVMGKPDPLNSQFRLTYNMVLNLLRVEGINPEYMLERSFCQFQNCQNLPKLLETVKNLHAEYEAIDASNIGDIVTYQTIKGKIQELHVAMLSIITKPIHIVPFIQPGRLIHVRHDLDDFGWCVCVNIHRKSAKNEVGDWNSHYSVDAIVPISPTVSGAKNLQTVHPPQQGEVPDAEVIPLFLECIVGISTVRIYYSRDLRSPQARKAVLDSVEAVKRKFPESQGGLPLLDPIEDMGIKDEGFKETVRYIEELEKRLAALPIRRSANFDELMNVYNKKKSAEERLSEAQRELQKAHSLMQMDELSNRKRVLRRLGYCTNMDMITLKGRVACEISAADELLLTEFLFDGKFSDLDPATCAAVLSCMVFQENAESVELTDEFKELVLKLQRVAKRIIKATKEVNIPIDEDAYLENIRPQLMPLVYAWCKGSSFQEITSKTNIFEGSIARSMRRLAELLEEMCRASKAMGNDDLVALFSTASVAIKRDIMFAPSLYL